MVVNGVTSITSIAAGYAHTCASIADGTVKCWGDNGDGELGNQTTIQSNSAVAAVASRAAAAARRTCAARACRRPARRRARQRHASRTAAAGRSYCGTRHAEGGGGPYFSCALRAGRHRAVLGLNGVGQLGDGTTTIRYQPAAVSGLTGASRCPPAATTRARCRAERRGAVLGLQHQRSARRRDHDVARDGGAVSGIANAVGRRGRALHACARLADGTAQVLGLQRQRPARRRDDDERTTPVAVDRARGRRGTWRRGRDAHLRAADERRGECWGDNGYGQLGNGTTRQPPVLGVRADGPTAGRRAAPGRRRRVRTSATPARARRRHDAVLGLQRQRAARRRSTTATRVLPVRSAA